MRTKSDAENILARYLLGQLPETEQQRIEERFFTDEEFLAQLLVVEDDLIDDYAQGRLVGAEREGFEKFFLASPRRRQRVAFATTVAGHFSETSAAQEAMKDQAAVSFWQSLAAFFNSWAVAPKLAFVALALLMTLGGAWLIFQEVRLSKRLEQARAEQTIAQQREQELRERERKLQESNDRERARNEELAQELERQNNELARLRELEQKQQELPGIASFRLTPYLLRDIDKPKRLTIPSHAEFARLELSFSTEQNYRSYRAKLRIVGGNEVWSQAGLRDRKTSTSRTLTLILPTSLLNRADYILTLAGVSQTGEVEDVTDFYFSILKP